eukprot:899661-Prymnesium_polylepis.1
MPRTACRGLARTRAHCTSLERSRQLHPVDGLSLLSNRCCTAGAGSFLSLCFELSDANHSGMKAEALDEGFQQLCISSARLLAVLEFGGHVNVALALWAGERGR